MPSNILKKDELSSLKIKTSHTHCGRCENNCALTINKFSTGKTFITGNRCEKYSFNKEGDPAGTSTINIFELKRNRLFSYKPSEGQRGEIGIPRVLNMYENYPFWFTFFTSLGYKVTLSPYSDKTIYEKGMSSIPSDTVCYPAKIAHGHIVWLAENGVKTIFYPSINYELFEDKDADNHYNCPIVATYPETIRANLGTFLKKNGVKLLTPFIPFDNRKRLPKKLSEILNIPLKEVKRAVHLAEIEEKKFKADVKAYGEEGIKNLDVNKGKKLKDKIFTLIKIDEGGGLGATKIRLRSLKVALLKNASIDISKIGIVLAGRPYHLDPEVNHGIDTLITSLGFSVFTEDSVAQFGREGRKLRILDQWTYHSRIYKAADFVRRTDNLELVELNSFGCGPDAIVADQVKEILKKKDDEIYKYERLKFSKENKKDYTILMPQMSPFHFDILETLLNDMGYKTLLLPEVDKGAIEEGLRYVNNDACYPTIVTLGQIIAHLKSGETDLSKTAVFMSQTGGGCRASNYVALLRKALHELNMPDVPVISFNMAGLEKNPGFSISAKFLYHAIFALLIGDVLMQCYHKTAPYEVQKGSVESLYKKHKKFVLENIGKMSSKKFEKIVSAIVSDFDNIELKDEKKPRVGVVGEILVKYHPMANNDITKVIENEGGEAVVPGIVDFFLYGMYSKKYNFNHLSGTFLTSFLNQVAVFIIEHYRNKVRKILKKSNRFDPPSHIKEVAKKAEKITSLGNQCGEGWLLTGEMIELIDEGVKNIICLQPFACLPNHVVGKGMQKLLREYDEKANIVPIDYDPGASEVNQINRIKLMMANCKI